METKSISKLYQEQIEYNAAKSPYIKNFLRNPYSFIKARYYMFFASILVFYLQRTAILPSTITKIYILFGFISSLLLAIPDQKANYIAIFMIFSKGILDWTDGHLARLKNKTSLTGHVLDIYGARIHSLTFIIGLGIYQYFYFDHCEIFLASLFIYPFCYGTLLTKFSNQYILDAITRDKVRKSNEKNNIHQSIKDKYTGLYSFFSWFLDDRSRTIDFVLVLILLENFGGPALSWIFFIGVNIKWIALWFGSFIFSSREYALEKQLMSKIIEIKDE